MSEKRRRVWVVLCVGGAAVIVTAVLCLCMHRALTAIPCPFRAATGLLCPSCGNTGAALALLRGDVATAVRYNAFCFLEFAYIAWILLKMTVSYVRCGTFTYRSPCVAVDIAVLIAVFAWGIVRNFL